MKPKPKDSKPDLRSHPIRRQFNEAFCDESGHFSVGKFLAVWAQISILAHMNRYFEQLINKPDTLLILLVFLIAPHIIVKIANWKFGGADAAASKPAR